MVYLEGGSGFAASHSAFCSRYRRALRWHKVVPWAVSLKPAASHARPRCPAFTSPLPERLPLASVLLEAINPLAASRRVCRPLLDILLTTRVPPQQRFAALVPSRDPPDRQPASSPLRALLSAPWVRRHHKAAPQAPIKAWRGRVRVLRPLPVVLSRSRGRLRRRTRSPVRLGPTNRSTGNHRVFLRPPAVS